MGVACCGGSNDPQMKEKIPGNLWMNNLSMPRDRDGKHGGRSRVSLKILQADSDEDYDPNTTTQTNPGRKRKDQPFQM